MQPVEGLGLTILILALKHTYQLCGIGQFLTLTHNHISPRQWQPYEQLFRRPYWGSSEWHSRRMNWRTVCQILSADVCTSLNASSTVHKLLVRNRKTVWTHNVLSKVSSVQYTETFCNTIQVLNI